MIITTGSQKVIMAFPSIAGGRLGKRREKKIRLLHKSRFLKKSGRRTVNKKRGGEIKNGR